MGREGCPVNNLIGGRAAGTTVDMFSRKPLLFVLALPLTVGCSKPTPWTQLLTPSGTPCPDMPIFPAGDKLEREYHRLKPIKTKGWFTHEDKSKECTTGPERLQLLRE